MARALLRTLFLVSLAACACAAPALAGQEAFLRVDQLGYGALAPKRAYLMTNFDAAGTPFTVTGEAGAVVFSGTVGAATGSWSKAFPNVYPLDFDGLRPPGSSRLAPRGTGSP